MPNGPILRQRLARIEADPHLWDQTVWMRRTACGTAGCFAGTAALLAGAIPSTCYDPDGAVEFCLDSDGEEWYIRIYARIVLKLSYEQADLLFNGENTLGDLRRIVDTLAGPKEPQA